MAQPSRRRQMPTLLAIVEWWTEQRPDTLQLRSAHVGYGEPFCFRCGWLVPYGDDLPEHPSRAFVWKRAMRWLDRAHLIDHCNDGLDDVQNLAALCALCHAEMPSFSPGQESEAVAWVREGRRRVGQWQLVTDEVQPKDRHMLARLWRHYLEKMAAA